MVSQTSSKTGVLRVAAFKAVGTVDAVRVTKALEAPAKEAITRAEIENFMVAMIYLEYGSILYGGGEGESKTGGGILNSLQDGET